MSSEARAPATEAMLWLVAIVVMAVCGCIAVVKQPVAGRTQYMCGVAIFPDVCYPDDCERLAEQIAHETGHKVCVLGTDIEIEP